MKIGIIGGTVLFESELFVDSRLQSIKTEFGNAEIYEKGNFLLIQRHGTNRNIPPHSINHQANLTGLKSFGAEKIISLNSTGTLNLKIKPRSIVIPDDFISLWNIPSIYSNKIQHVVPHFDEPLRNEIIKASKRIKQKVVAKGVYVQTIGPRFETKAETRMLKNYADVVGMTVASEATIANEVNIPYAAICSVDNYCNGLTKNSISYELVKEIAKKNQTKMRTLLEATIRQLK